MGNLFLDLTGWCPECLANSEVGITLCNSINNLKMIWWPTIPRTSERAYASSIKRHSMMSLELIPSCRNLAKRLESRYNIKKKGSSALNPAKSKWGKWKTKWTCLRMKEGRSRWKDSCFWQNKTNNPSSGKCDIRKWHQRMMKSWPIWPKQIRAISIKSVKMSRWAIRSVSYRRNIETYFKDTVLWSRNCRTPNSW